MAHVLVLPPGAALIHGIAEGNPRVGIGEAERAAGAEMTEGARARPQAPLGLRELKAETEACGPLQTMSSA